MHITITRGLFVSLAIMAMLLITSAVSAEEYDLVISNGRVMNPANGLDSVRNIGIRDGRIAALSREALEGSREIDATGLVVAPGFIDLHAHFGGDEQGVPARCREPGDRLKHSVHDAESREHVGDRPHHANHQPYAGDNRQGLPAPQDRCPREGASEVPAAPGADGQGNGKVRGDVVLRLPHGQQERRQEREREQPHEVADHPKDEGEAHPLHLASQIAQVIEEELSHALF